jgi:Tol biopolymer transport system component
MLVVTWPAEEFLLLTRNFDDRINPEVNTQLQLWDIDAEELTLIVDNAIFGRFSPDGHFLAYQILSPTPQFHIMDFESRQVIHTIPNAEPTLEPRIAASNTPYLWSPDSTKIIFRDSQGNLTVLTVADGSLTPLSLSGGERLQNPQWSYDGRFLSVSVQNESGGEMAVLAINASSSEE